ncbi:hypothetical protein TrVFT333_003176 [Trichoderma virens FT-333]|nr:hypothetical protein TrVFT333_003176 [Trichoderma virens FT-333]
MTPRRKARDLSSSNESAIYRDLEDAICLLASIIDRQPDLGLALDLELDHDVEKTQDSHDGIEEVDDLSILDAEKDEAQSLTELQNKFLDRLAEALARFKTNPKNRSSPDAKHVSSTLMVVYKHQQRVKIMCSKNEGLDEEDRTFLGNWKIYMEAVANTGTASQHLKDSMFDLVFNHQRPRISTYLEKLRRTFQCPRLANRQTNQSQRALTESLVKKLPWLNTKVWIDDKGFEYEIPSEHPACDGEEISEAVLTGQSFKDVDVGIFEYFQTIEKLCGEEILETQDFLLKNLMRMTLELWKGARTRAAVKSHLRRYFGEDPTRQKEAEKILCFTAKIYQIVRIFIEAAERLPVFKSIELVEVSPRQSAPKNATTRPSTPLEACKRLGISVNNINGINYLSQLSKKFGVMVKERRNKHHFHAEIQMLCSRDALLSCDERKQTHPYIGCSRRCCMLCYAFLRFYGGFKMRGTHETVMHRWEIPLSASIREDFATDYRVAKIRTVNFLKHIIRDLITMPHPASRQQLLAQSSCALSSAQVMVEKEVETLEHPIRERENMMMMPGVVDDGIMFLRMPDKPEYAFILGGGEHSGKEMLLSEAELLKDDYIRSKLGFEKQNEMPPIGTPTLENADFRIFGFNNCVDDSDVAELLCLYKNLLRSFKSSELQHMVDRQLLGDFIHISIINGDIKHFGSWGNKSCFHWFQSRRLEGFEIPNVEGPFLYQNQAWNYVEQLFPLQREDETWRNLSYGEKRMLNLYRKLLRGFNNRPDSLSAEELEFGFVRCANDSQREALAAAYIKLAKIRIPLDQIAHAWMESSLGPLMQSKGIDITPFLASLKNPRWTNLASIVSWPRQSMRSPAITAAALYEHANTTQSTKLI